MLLMTVTVVHVVIIYIENMHCKDKLTFAYTELFVPIYSKSWLTIYASSLNLLADLEFALVEKKFL